MSPEERNELVTRFIEHMTRRHVLGPDSALREEKGREDLRAFAPFDEISRRDLDLTWELILQVLHTPHEDSVTAVLAAGPLEDLLARIGPIVIDRVEQRAAPDPDFRDLLGGVWRSSMSPEFWARVEACRGQPW